MKRGGNWVQSAKKHRHQLRKLLAFGLACALTLPMWSTGFSLAADTDPASVYDLDADSTPCVIVGDRQVTDWQWVDEEEMLVREDGVWYWSLPGVGPELAVDREVLQALLPARLSAVLQDGFVEELELTWDLSAVPEEGAYEGSYPLTASLPEEYSLAETAPALEVLLELGGAGMYAINVALNEWEWEGLGKGAEACITIITDGIQSKSALLSEIKKRLPSRIYGWSMGDKSVNDGAWTYANKQEYIDVTGLGSRLCSYGYLDVNWSGLTESDLPELSALNSEFTIYAPIPSYTGRNYYVSDGNNTTNVEKLPIKIHPISYAAHTVPAAAPGNVTVNLFDYYVEDGKDGSQSGVDDRLTKNIGSGSGYETQSSSEEVWNNGINKGRLLLFGEASMVHAGFWNIGAGAGRSWGKAHTNMKGIVEPVLGEDGYPHIDLTNAQKGSFTVGEITNVSRAEDAQGSPGHNLSATVLTGADAVGSYAGGWDFSGVDTSLAYLFDKTETTYKTPYQNVTGLFQLDSQGYYYYNARQNFAEYDSASNRFNLYNGPAVWRTDAGYNSETGAFDGAKSLGNFFPFNSASQVFDSLTADGKLTSSEGLTNVDNAVRADHHMGMTVTVDFRQPANGKINSGSNARPMTFQFSGDDDVWIFIDDVLVLDIGGIHSELCGTIDFSTGDVYIGQSWRTNGEITGNEGKRSVTGSQTTQAIDYYTLRGLFENAGKAKTTKWNGNTFASNTSHTLKMFYLERGNYDSSLALRFNLQPLLYQQIRKVDQNGNPVKGVEFQLYPAQRCESEVEGAVECLYTDNSGVGNNETFYVKKSNDTSPVTLTTKEDGSTQFKMADGSFFNFADRGDAYYILRESKTPDGYRAQPVDIVLHYDVKTSMLSVANRWTTGAYACSVAHVTGPSKAEHGEGLVMAVPLLKKKDGKWYPLYGDNLDGFHTAPDVSNAGILLAALYQAKTQDKDSLADWHLSWDAANSQLKDTLSDLPGLATRYTLIDPVHGDLQLAYVQISQAALSALGVTGSDSNARYESLHRILQNTDTTPEKVQAAIIEKGYKRLETDVFNREFRSLIFVPNERRELRVLKMDEDGKPLERAQFTLYSDEGCTVPAATGKTDANGMLVFSPTGDSNKLGQAKMVWAKAGNETKYYLKETAAPADYTVNDTVTPVVVGIYSIYADAGEKDDGVSVMAGVGRLTQTMHQFGKPNDVDITLQDITAFMQTQKSTKDGGTFQLDGWEDVKLGNTDVLRSMNLHYNMNNHDGELVDYGLHNEDGGEYFRPFFVTDTGFVRARVQQMPAAEKSKYESAPHSDANWDNLGSTHLTNLFSLLNVVVVTDRAADPSTPSAASLTISKKVEGPGLAETDYTRNFSFQVELTDADGAPLDGNYQYNFYGKDKWGYLSNGDTLLLHHDESVTILGLPEGTKFKVTETDLPSGWSATPGADISGTVGEKEAAFTNVKGDPPSKPDEPDRPEESEKPTPSPSPMPTPMSTPAVTPSPSPTPGVTPVPDATPIPEPTPTAAPPTETPAYPPELPDPNDPDSPEVITIEEEGVPKTYVKVWNPETEEWEYIDEEEVPLWSAVPETGEGSDPIFWAALAAISLGSLSALILPRKKRGDRRVRKDL